MSSDVHGQPFKAQLQRNSSLPTASIALVLRVAILMMPTLILNPSLAQSATNPAASTSSVRLPILRNTPEADRRMLREIADEHIFDKSSPDSVWLDHQMSHDPNIVTRVSTVMASSDNLHVWQMVQQSRRLRIPENKKIATYLEQYRQEAPWIGRILNRATPFIGHIVEALHERYLPAELALLPAIESGYQPEVHSAENAVGIWQIVPATAEEIGIKRTVWFDGRSDIIESTIAALDYLSYLNAEFNGNWPLTLAAYNAGPGRVRSAIRQNRQRGRSTDFWSLQLPRETMNYVPKYLALVEMVRNSRLHEFEIPRIERGDRFDIIDIGQRASVDKLATIGDINEVEFRRLNAGWVHGVTPPEGPHHFYVNKQLSSQLIQNIISSGETILYTLPATHIVMPGESISTIAAQYGLLQKQLQDMNALTGSTIYVGQELAVRHNAASDSASIEYVVTIGDTLSDIASRFSVKLDAIRDANGTRLTSDLIHPGISLSILIDTDKAG